MASEFGKDVATGVVDAIDVRIVAHVLTGNEFEQCATAADKSLQEVREVLNVFLTDPAHNLDCAASCDQPCDCHVQRARALMGKLFCDG